MTFEETEIDIFPVYVCVQASMENRRLYTEASVLYGKYIAIHSPFTVGNDVWPLRFSRDYEQYNTVGKKIMQILSVSKYQEYI